MKKHSLAGRKQSPEHIAKRVAAHKLSGAWPYTWTEEDREWQRQNNLGKKQTAQHKAKIAASMKGKQNCLGHRPSEEHRRALADYWAQNREKHNNYVDGKGFERTSERIADMGRIEYRLWREKVFTRDNWTCVLCGERGGKLHADHIKPYNLHPELRYDLTNGRTLCVPCHHKQPTHGSGSKRRK